MKSQSIKLLSLCCLLSVTAACHRSTAADHLRQGMKFVEAKQDKEAIVEFRLAVQADPRFGDARTETRRRVSAASETRRARCANTCGPPISCPKNIDAQIKAGQLLLVARAFDDARTRADRAVAIDANNVDAQVLRGNALAGLKDLDGAITEYEEAIALDPSKISAYSNLGAIQAAQGKRDEAEETFRKAVEASPQSLTARLALANFLWSSGRRADSEQTFKDALAIDPCECGGKSGTRAVLHVDRPRR